MTPSDDATPSMDWMSQGACQREDPELFFPITPAGPALEQINAAKRVCLCCTVRAACLSFGLKTTQDGIWGGTTPGERRAIRKRPASVAAQISRLADPARCLSQGSSSSQQRALAPAPVAAKAGAVPGHPGTAPRG